MLRPSSSPASLRDMKGGGKGGVDSGKRWTACLVVLCLGALLVAAPMATSSWSATVDSHVGPRGPMVDVKLGNLRLRLAESYPIKIVTDLDQGSRMEGSKPKFHALLQDATLHFSESGVVSVQFQETTNYVTGHNEAGRGMELSELVVFNGMLLSFDDRTGLVYELTRDGVAVPRYTLMEGDGRSNKGQKSEWATIKDGRLYVGSIGKEYTDNDGNVVSTANLWVSVIDARGQVTHEDWSDRYQALRKATHTQSPGYMIHEAMEWSPMRRQWIVLPRREDQQGPYNDVVDEDRGTNLIITADEGFRNIQSTRVGTKSPKRGFSTFKFVPGSQDRVIVAVKSEEVAETDYQTAYLTVFTIDGHVLMEETEIPGSRKFEGLSFV